MSYLISLFEVQHLGMMPVSWYIHKMAPMYVHRWLKMALMAQLLNVFVKSYGVDHFLLVQDFGTIRNSSRKDNYLYGRIA